MTLDDRLARRALFVLIAAQAVIFASLCAIKYHFLLYDDIDLAIFTQALANLLRGSLETPLRGMSWLGDHSSLNLFLLAPLFALFRSPLTLLTVQCVALALGAWPVYVLARRELDHPGAALGCATLYLLYPAVGYVNLFEFHPEALSTPAVLAAFAMLRAGRVAPMAFWSAIALLGKEDVALVVAAMGIYALVGARIEGRPAGGRAAAWLLGLAAASLALSFAVVKPWLASGAADYGRMYEAWGRTPGEVLGALLRHPLAALRALIETPGDARDTLFKQEYWLQMLLPLGFLPLAAPEVLCLALPVVFEHMLSWRTQQHTILYQYTALVIPWTLAAAVLGVGRIARRGKPGAAARLVLASMGCAIVSQVMFGPVVGRGALQAARPLQRAWPTAEDRGRAAEARRLLARVPRNGAVVAGPGLLAPLAVRPVLHSLHHVVTGVYTFSERPFPIPDSVTAIVADASAARLLPLADLGTGGRLRELVRRNRLVLAEVVGDLMLYLREPGAGETPTAPAGPSGTSAPRVVFDGQLAFLGAALASRAVPADGVLEFETRWRRAGTIDRLYITEWLVIDAAGGIRIQRQHPLGYMIEPPGDWPPGTDFRESFRLPLWRGARPGSYGLAMRVGSQSHGHAALARADDPALAAHQGVLMLGAFDVTGAAGR